MGVNLQPTDEDRKRDLEDDFEYVAMSEVLGFDTETELHLSDIAAAVIRRCLDAEGEVAVLKASLNVNCKLYSSNYAELIERCSVSENRIDVLVKTLQGIEWVGSLSYPYDKYCPCCRWRQSAGHKPKDCALAAALGGEE